MLMCLLSFALFMSGCASILSKSEYPVSFFSSQKLTSFCVKNSAGKVIHKGKTPQTISLKASSGFFESEKYTVIYLHNGTRQKILIPDTLDPWYVSNLAILCSLPVFFLFDFWLTGSLLFNCLIGCLLIDPISGSMWHLPEFVHLTSLNKQHEKTKIDYEKIRMDEGDRSYNRCGY